jgi:L-rhamnose-H+ transport protein
MAGPVWSAELNNGSSSLDDENMNQHLISACAYILVAGVMNSAYTLPLKLTRRWNWENTWFAFTVLGLCVLPVMTAALTIPHFWSIYREVGSERLLTIICFGAGWGAALVLFGRAVGLIGVALTFALVMGTSSAVGSLTPLLFSHPARPVAQAEIVLMVGLTLNVLGVGVCGAAGRQRERDEATRVGVTSSDFLRGFMYALFSGVCGSMLNFGFAFGSSLLRIAKNNGASADAAANVVWVPILLAGAVPGIIYSVYLLRKNSSAKKFMLPGTLSYWFFAFGMGILWFGSVVLYGVAALRIGDLGTVLGWPLFMTAIVLASAGWGALTGEWRNAGKRAQVLMASGTLILLLTFVVLAGART